MSRSDISVTLMITLPLAAFMSWIYARIGATLILPDFGDLWRWASGISVDGELTGTELFSEVETIGHSSVLSLLAAHVSAESTGYQLMWIIGAFGLVIGAAVIGLIALDALTESAVSGRTFLAAVIGLSVVRFDVAGVTTNSLLLFEQLYIAMTYVAIFLVCQLLVHSRNHDSLASLARARGGLLATLFFLLVVSDAPGSVLVLVLIAYGLGASVFRSSLTRGLQLAGLVAVLSVAIRWAVRAVAGTDVNRSRGSLTEAAELQTIEETFQLIGSAVANLGRFISTERRLDTFHLWLGILFTLVAAVVVIGLYRNAMRAPDPELAGTEPRHFRLLSAAALFAGYVVVGSLSIAISRDLFSGYHLSRFVRSTALAGPAAALLLIGLAVLLPRSIPTKRLALGLGAAFLLLVVVFRVPSLTLVRNRLPILTQSRTAAVQLVCDNNSTPDRWTPFWSALGDEDRIPLLLDSELFPSARNQCLPGN